MHTDKAVAEPVETVDLEPVGTEEDPETDATPEYPTRDQETATIIVGAIRSVRTSCTSENAAGVLLAIARLEEEAEELYGAGFENEATWTREAADLVRTSLRADEEPRLGLAPELEEEDEPEDDDEIVEPE